MEGLLQAHDSIASLTDRIYCSPSNMNTMQLQAKIPLHHTTSNSLKNESSKSYSSSNEDIKKVIEKPHVAIKTLANKSASFSRQNHKSQRLSECCAMVHKITLE